MRKNHTKTLAFTILDTSQLKKLMIVKRVYSVNPLYLFISHANRYIEEKSGNKYLVFDSTDEIINNNNNNNKRVTELMQ